MRTIITAILLSLTLLISAQSVEVKGTVTFKTIKQEKNGKIDTVITNGSRCLITLFNKVDSKLISIAEDNGEYYFYLDLRKTPYTHVQFLNMNGGSVSFPIKDIKFPFFDVDVVKIEGAVDPNIRTGFKVDMKKASEKGEKPAAPITAEELKKAKKEKQTKKKAVKPTETSTTPLAQPGKSQNPEPLPVVEPASVPAPEVEKSSPVENPKVATPEPEKKAEIQQTPAPVETPKSVIPEESPKAEAPQVSTPVETQKKEVTPTTVPAENKLLPEEPEEEQAAEDTPKAKPEKKKKKDEVSQEDENAKLQKEIQELDEQIKKEKEQQNATQGQ
jgi:hypothetical protein